MPEAKFFGKSKSSKMSRRFIEPIWEQFKNRRGDRGMGE